MRTTLEYFPRLIQMHLAELGSRHPRIFFMGTDEQQDKSGFIQTIHRLARIHCSPLSRIHGGKTVGVIKIASLDFIIWRIQARSATLIN